jgi:hypothetical protein
MVGGSILGVVGRPTIAGGNAGGFDDVFVGVLVGCKFVAFIGLGGCVGVIVSCLVRVSLEGWWAVVTVVTVALTDLVSSQKSSSEPDNSNKKTSPATESYRDRRLVPRRSTVYRFAPTIARVKPQPSEISPNLFRYGRGSRGPLVRCK